MTDFQDHPSACKFCRVPVTLRIQADALDMLDISKWLGIAACNRCGDYHSRRNAIVAGVQAIATKWQQASQTLADGERDELQDECRRSLEKLTRRLADNASQHYRCGHSWESDWVQQILENPQNATKSCTFYERQMWRAWNRARQEVRESVNV